jgi:hypothetical protein
MDNKTKSILLLCLGIPHSARTQIDQLTVQATQLQDWLNRQNEEICFQACVGALTVDIFMLRKESKPGLDLIIKKCYEFLSPLIEVTEIGVNCNIGLKDENQEPLSELQCTLVIGKTVKECWPQASVQNLIIE